MPKFIEIAHPDVAATGRATEEAFEKVWSQKGWVRIEDATLPDEEPEEEDVLEEELDLASSYYDSDDDDTDESETDY